MLRHKKTAYRIFVWKLFRKSVCRKNEEQDKKNNVVYLRDMEWG